MTPLFGFFSLQPWEIIVLLALGVLLFGRKLPEVGKYLGKGIIEFKKGLKGIEDEVDSSSVSSRRDSVPMEQPRPPQRLASTAPKFEEAPSEETPATNDPAAPTT